MITPDYTENIIKRWTGDAVNDPTADRDALVALVAAICTDGDQAAADALIMSWRRQELEDRRRGL